MQRFIQRASIVVNDIGCISFNTTIQLLCDTYLHQSTCYVSLELTETHFPKYIIKSLPSCVGQNQLHVFGYGNV